MATTPETISPTQLKRARTSLWHQDGEPLRTLEDARSWLDAAGLVPYYPHAQFAAAPQPSFAEAILGRPETGWIPGTAVGTPDAEDAAGSDDQDPEDDLKDPEDDESDSEDDLFDEDEDLDEEDPDDEDFEGEDEDPEDEDLNEEDLDGAEDLDAVGDATGPEATDDEVMVSDEDEFAEDQGDEIAEEDRIDAGGDPVPNDLREGSASVTEAEDAPPPADPVNGFCADEKETVSRTLARMVADGSAVPLNLLGSTTGEPDYVCSAQAFSFVYTLRGDKGWKQEPAQTGSMRVSPLAVKVYALLKEKGSMAPHELTHEAGQGVVDSAVLRALSELWAIQRVLPVPDPDGQPAKWELMSGRFVRHLKAGANAGQPTALSALLSLYLSQAVAATSDEMEIFLSPLAARSRVREVVGGLSASRQLDSVVMEGKNLMFMPGALDSLPADAPSSAGQASSPRSRYEDDDRRAMIEERSARQLTEGGVDRKSSYPVRRPAGARSESDRGGRPGAQRSSGFGGPRREGGFAPPRRSSSFGGPKREGASAGGRDERERRPFVRREEGASSRARNEFARPWDSEGGERKPFPPRSAEGERRPFQPREGAERRPFTPRDAEGRRPFTPRTESERGGFGDRRPSNDRKPFGDRRPFAPREGGGERRPFTPRGEGERRPFTPREGGDRKPFVPRGDRPFTPRAEGERRPFVPREGGERRPFVPREGGDRRPFTPREGGRSGSGDRRSFAPREGGDRRPFTPRADRPFAPREDGERRPFTPRGDRPFPPRSSGERRPFTPREGGERRPFVPREGGEGRPFTPRSDRPFTPRENSDRRPFTPRGDRPSPARDSVARKPFGDRQRSSGDRGGPAEGRPSRDRFSGETGERRPAFQAGAKSAGPGGAKFGGSGFSRGSGAQGKFGKPGFSPARRGPGSGPGRGGAPKRRPE